MSFTDILKLVAAIVVCEMAGVVGAVFSAPAIREWYVNLAKPKFSPPKWVFAPVWTALYAIMGIAAFLVWQTGWANFDVRFALGIFIGQLVLNIFWSYLFFGLKSPLAAFVEIILLWLAIFATVVNFSKISMTAAWLLAPYLAWVSFAAVLNFNIWQLNHGQAKTNL